MAAEYYIRWRGKVSGPFQQETLQDMVRTGRLSRHHQLSTDRREWMPAADADCLQEFYARKEKSAGIRLAETRTPTGFPPSQVSDRAPETERVAASDGGANATIRLKSEGRQGRSLPPSGERWYYADGEVVEGPEDIPGLLALVRSGGLQSHTPICREGTQMWQLAQDVFPEFWRAARMSRGGTAKLGQSIFTYAGFWRRLVAIWIDLILLSFFAGIAVAILFQGNVPQVSEVGEETGVVSLVQLLLTWLYFTLLESSSMRATLGKRALGVEVTDLDGQQITFGRANGRFWGKLLSGAILGIGYLLAAFTEKKQALHDMLAGTLVIKRIRLAQVGS